jgi:hypothetical protein
MRRIASLSLLLAVAGCASKDATPDTRPGHDAARLEAAAPADAVGGACPSSFTPCGGDVVGSWSLDTVCPAGGASLSKPCDHPFADLPACTGSENQATCTNVYGGSITLAADGKSTVATSLHAEMEILLSDACVLAVAGGASASTACPNLKTKNGKALDCSYTAGLCRCRLETEPETQTLTDVYQVTGTELVVTPSSAGEKIGGAYCITKNELVIRGVIGWAYWVLHRI